ncbi:MAG TPA: DUF559 domain-containing protein [Nocardioidaceae bacterium]|nr:DUF559 domain-containing protein [Nocardioidaceae bacterium]
MHVTQVLARLGGVADAGELVAATSRRRVRVAFERGDIVRTGGGGYALPTASDARRAAQAIHGVITGPSAAAYWGWELKRPPQLPHVTVPRTRKVDPARRPGIDVHWRDIDPADVYEGLVTRPAATVITCARDLEFDEALAVADSALRHDDVTVEELVLLASRLPRGRAKVMRVVRAADPRAANPFESVLRAIALDVPGLCVTPQVEIDDRGFSCRPDLVDVERRIVIEADSFEFHAGREALRRDCRRYTALVIRGWIVVRFSWEDVMLRPEYVRLTLGALVGGPVGPERHALLAKQGL